MGTIGNADKNQVCSNYGLPKKTNATTTGGTRTGHTDVTHNNKQHKVIVLAFLMRGSPFTTVVR